MMLALTGCTGKIGGAVLRAILEHSLIPPANIVVCTSSNPEDTRWDSLRAQGASIRQSNYDDIDSMQRAFIGCSKLFLVSTPHIDMDFNDARIGRERHHINAIRAAQNAGVEHIYYTSLAFGSNSNAGVMRAHLRTEAFLRELTHIKTTIIREGLYNESWPLYFGYYNVEHDERSEIVTAGEGLISWTAISDLGVASALVILDPTTKYAGATLYLSGSKAHSLKDVAAIVSEAKGREIRLKTVSRDRYVEYYTEMGKDRAFVEWWSTTYAALEQNECKISDTTLQDLLSSKGMVAKPVQETIKEMLGA
jgi:uncharacterized protein YbjT (DUF2867 family)